MNKQIQTITGRLGKTPVVYMRDTKNGRAPVAKFSLAATTFVDGKEGTVWWQISAWDKRAKLCAKNLRKGDAVQLFGFASKDKFMGREGPEEYLHFNAVYVSFLGKAKANMTQAAITQAAAVVPSQAVLPGISAGNPF